MAYSFSNSILKTFLLTPEYLNEHLLPGQLGQLFIIIAFVTALFSTYSYLKAVRLKDQGLAHLNYKKAARWAFIIQSIAVFGIFVCMYVIITRHYFEYSYAWQHSSKGLQMKYLLSSFWEGSEGSFLLWIICHNVLGLIFIATEKIWEERVMVVVNIVQALLLTMVLGVQLGELQIGSSPFVLLRDTMDSPIFSRPDYLDFIEDGQGLNPLLQNYWMVIHPPMLFLGFAMTLFPFALSIAALWKGEYKTWIKPTLRWSLMSGAIFGAGIMMGGAWAYESLNFGGYWAWDPVENASLVPWLILIAGIHTLVVYRSTGRSLKITLIFFILTFAFVWYSTFLTRTGVLGDTSVHSFTGKGDSMFYHLLIILGLIIAVSVGLLIKQWKKMPHVAGEEHISTREFWMLIGSIVILLASVQIIFYTSLPVWAPLYNWITNTEIAPPTDPITFYNNIQVWFAIVIALLSGTILFLKYKKTNVKQFLKRITLLALISLGLTIMLVIGQEIAPLQLKVFTFSIFFTLVANLYYIISVQKGKVFKAGAAITHIGFGMMLIGILLSGYKKHVISLDRTGRVMDFGHETFEENVKESRENVLIFRNTTIPMGPYYVSYLGDSIVSNDPPLTYFKLRYEKRHPETNELIESFIMKPNSFVNPKGETGLSSNPDNRSYWTHDVFTYITSISDPEGTDTSEYRPVKVKRGDSIYVANGYLVFEDLSTDITNNNYEAREDDIAVQAIIKGYDLEGPLSDAHPMFIINGSQVSHLADTLRELGLSVRINSIIPEEDRVELAIKQRAQQDDYIVLKVVIFPYIRFLWLGLIVMCAGFVLAWFNRRR